MIKSIETNGFFTSNILIQKQTRLAFFLYCVYLLSFFLRFPARFPVLGIIRFDLLLVFLILFLVLGAKSAQGSKLDSASKYLLAILIYSIITLPIVEWPGSVVYNGMTDFLKGAIFYFFTVKLVVDINRLKTILFIVIACNLVRVIEPLFLNITFGYLGSSTYVGGSEFVGRLAGAPADTINPNGLAFVIATVIPFLHYVFRPISVKTKIIYVLLIPILLYTMGLTLSRSGILALGIIGFGIFFKSKNKFRFLILGFMGVCLIWILLTDIQKDRYLSLVSDDSKQSSTADARVEGWLVDFEVAMNKPLVGHGLGTSREANWNIAGKDQISHILWAEIWQEIGFIGLVLFSLYLFAMIKNFRDAGALINEHLPTDDFLYRANQAMQVWLLMNLLFSLASYGLKSYEWYLFGGLSVVLLNAVRACIAKNADSETIAGSLSRDERFRLAQKVR